MLVDFVVDVGEYEGVDWVGDVFYVVGGYGEYYGYIGVFIGEE